MIKWLNNSLGENIKLGTLLDLGTLIFMNIFDIIFVFCGDNKNRELYDKASSISQIAKRIIHSEFLRSGSGNVLFPVILIKNSPMLLSLSPQS